MKVTFLLRALLFFTLSVAASESAYCQVKNYRCVKKYPSLNRIEQVDSAIFSVAIDEDNKTIDINEPTPIRLTILRKKQDVVTNNKKVVVYKVKELNGRRGKVVFVSDNRNEKSGSPILYYSPLPLIVWRKTAEMHPPRIWSLASL